MMQRRLLSTLRSTTFAASKFNRAAVSFQFPSRSMCSHVVTKEEAKKLPREFEEMSNDTITILARMGDQEAREERLIREIMRCDDVDWQSAQPRFQEMRDANRTGMWLATFPYKVGLVASVSGAVLSIPMVFDYNTILWFNEHYVTTGTYNIDDTIFIEISSITSTQRPLIIFQTISLIRHSRAARPRDLA